MTDKGRMKLGNVKARDPLHAKWKRKTILKSINRSEVGIEEKKNDVDIQEAENKINTITRRRRIKRIYRRIKYFTIFMLIVMILVSTGIILYRGSICISK